MDVVSLTSWSLPVAIIAIICASIYTIVYLLRRNPSRPSNKGKEERQTVSTGNRYIDLRYDVFKLVLFTQGIDVKLFYGTQTGTAKVTPKKPLLRCLYLVS